MSRPEQLPKVFTQGESLRDSVLTARAAGKKIGLVPTMGALHEGHLSLVRAARRECDVVIVTIFVNPTQFAPGEDFDKYPRDLEQDQTLLATAGADWIFAPTVEEMYPAGCETSVDVGAAALPFEGALRPSHFRGVATIVLKLFNLAPADRAYFGRKDYQQTVVIRQMVRDLNVPLHIEVCPLVRDSDGLALSSRNARLTESQREQALAIPRSLELAERMHADNPASDLQAIQAAMTELLAASSLKADYIAFLRDGTLEPVTQLDQPTVIALAVPVGEIRLLDNTVIGY